MKDPEPYLKELGVELPCALVRGATAQIDRRFSARVNHEIYYFSMPSAVRKFRKDPARYCGTVTDPVSGERFVPDKKSPRKDHDGRPYFFASASTVATFAENPDEYADPKGHMLGMVPKEAETDAAPETSAPVGPDPRGGAAP